jgi:RNA polymerase sigma factor (sigma-70 family)
VKPLMVAAKTEATDEQLVAATRAGSDEAFEELFRRYQSRIAAYARGIVSDHARAEDIVQDAFVSALRSLRSSDRKIAFKPWVYEIAKNACIDHLRRARRGSEVSIDSEDFSPGDEGRLSASVASTDAACSAREELDTLKMAFNDLPDAQREVLVSREFEGLSYDKISSRTGLTRSAVESMLFRARRTLKDGFDDIATGERCQRMRVAMVSLSDGDVGLRVERRLARHLSDCAGCRREAIALGLDELAFGAAARGRARTAISRVAAFLPLPAFLRRRWLDGARTLGSAGPGGAAEQGATLAGKAAVVLAAAVIAGGGAAGVAHRSGAIWPGGDSHGRTALDRQASGKAGSGATAAHAGTAGHAGKQAGSKLSDKSAAKRGGHAEPGAGDTQTGAGAAADAGSVAKGATDEAGALTGGRLGSALGGGGTGDVGSTIGDTATGVGDTAGGAVGGTVGGVGGTVQGVGGTVGGPVGGTVNQVGGTVKGLGTTAGQTVTGVAGGATAPLSGDKSLPKTQLP